MSIRFMVDFKGKKRKEELRDLLIKQPVICFIQCFKEKRKNPRG